MHDSTESPRLGPGRIKVSARLDNWVCRVHTYLTVAASAVYATELVVGGALAVVEWDKPGSFPIEYFLLLRLLSYAYLIWSLWQDKHDYEPAHAGLHITYTLVYNITVITLLVASRSRRVTAMSVFLLLSMVLDDALTFVTWLVLRKCLQKIQVETKNGTIATIRKATLRYLEFIPPAEREKEEFTARHLLWQTFSVFDDVREFVARSEVS